jgi:hypothetical protein
VLPQKKLEMAITGVHTKVFAVSNLYKERLEAKEWDDVLQQTKNFVDEHHGVNQSLMRSFKKIKNASNKLVQEIQHAYDLFYIESTKPISNKTVKEKFAAKFDVIKKEMHELKVKLKKQLDENKLLTHGEEKIATVLHRLALTLETTAVKARNDLFKE